MQENQEWSRQVLDLESGWRFRQGEWPQAANPGFDDQDWELVDLPHDYIIQSPPTEQVPAGLDPEWYCLHGFRPTSPGWYRLDLPQLDLESGRRVLLECDGIFNRSRLWINGQELEGHTSGYTGFIRELTGGLDPQGKNLLAIRVDPGYDGWWYEGGGIYRPVRLYLVPACHIALWGIRVAATVAVQDGKATRPAELAIDCELAGFEPSRGELTVTHRVFSQDGILCSHCQGPHQAGQAVGAQTNHTKTQTMNLDQPRLWSVDSPVLYRLQTSLSRHGVEIDRVDTWFGVRDLHFDPQNGFFLNGRHLMLKGVNAHQDHGGLGVAVPEEILAWRLHRLKEMGCNALRLSHNPVSPGMLDWCDRLGILVIAENRHLGDTQADQSAPDTPAVEHRVESTGPATRLALEYWPPGWSEGLGRLAVIRIAAWDSEGRFVPDADHPVSLEVSSEARVLGCGNGDPVNHDPGHRSQTRLFGGLAQGILLLSPEASQVEVLARSPTLGSAALSLSPPPAPPRPKGKKRPGLGARALALWGLILIIWGGSAMLAAQNNPPEPLLPIPSTQQYRWQTMEEYAFVHFSLNTYTNQAWGEGNEALSLFNPTELDCRQWARICKEAGFKGIIITAKHHSGFCLWPSAYTEYSVKNTPWKDGKGDVVGELAQACGEYGLKLGIYLSPWDRNHRDYGKPEYIDYFRKQLTELLTSYGPIFEVWFDGANGGTGYYGGANENRKIDPRTYYQWPETYRLIRRLQPECVIWNDGGDRGDLRWVGTEEGYVGETNWSILPSTGSIEWQMLHNGWESGDAWVAAEVNTSIRPEWFYHPEEDSKVKSVASLLDIYYNSVGRNASLLLNFPIMPNGLIHPADEAAALGLAEAVKKAFAQDLAQGSTASASNTRGKTPDFGPEKALDGNPETYWATDDSVNEAEVVIDLGRPRLVNRVVLQEYIKLGQRVRSFKVEAWVNGTWQDVAWGTTIGYKRILRFPTLETAKLKVSIRDSRDGVTLSTIGIYSAPSHLVAPLITRTQDGTVRITVPDPGAEFFYTLDGTAPSPSSPRYHGPLATGGKLTVRAIARDPVTGRFSPETLTAFDVLKAKWQILEATDQSAYRIFDGNSTSTWHHSVQTASGRKRLPVDLTVDMGEIQALKGFSYCPDQGRWSAGTISRFEFWVSLDNKDWTKVDQGEFANIRNNPIVQTRSFPGVKARYFRLRALRTIQGDGVVGYAEVDVLTE